LSASGAAKIEEGGKKGHEEIIEEIKIFQKMA